MQKITRSFAIIPFFFANLILFGVIYLSSKLFEIKSGLGLIASAGAILVGIGLATLLFYQSYVLKNKIIRVFLAILSLLVFLFFAGYILEELGFVI